MVGGLVYGFASSPVPVYGCAVVAYALAVLLLSPIRVKVAARASTAESDGLILEGLRYIWRSKLILGSISLDLFAVLLGGAVALLPVYAREILYVGASGLGLLRSAPALGCKVPLEDVTYYVGHETIMHSEQAACLPHWQEVVYAAMARNAVHITDFYRLPIEATVEIGRQVAI